MLARALNGPHQFVLLLRLFLTQTVRHGQVKWMRSHLALCGPTLELSYEEDAVKAASGRGDSLPTSSPRLSEQEAETKDRTLSSIIVDIIIINTLLRLLALVPYEGGMTSQSLLSSDPSRPARG